MNLAFLILICNAINNANLRKRRIHVYEKGVRTECFISKRRIVQFANIYSINTHFLHTSNTVVHAHISNNLK